MRTIGLLGGMSWTSSAMYYRLINERIRDVVGGFHSARCVLYSVDFADIEELQVENRWPAAAEILGQATRKVEAAGADLLLLCTNTMHKVAEDIEAAVRIPLLHIADATANAVLAAGMDRVGLLGTAYTMEQDYYRNRLAGHGIDVITPEAQDQSTVHRIIYDELVMGRLSDHTRQLYQQVIQRLGDSGAQGVVLGCAEIELLITDRDSPLPVFPTTALHAYAAIDAALAASPLSKP